MNRIIIIEFSTVDGVVDDPDGSFGRPWGGWSSEFGPEAVVGDKFRIGSILETGTLLFGRDTWQLFSTRWPSRTTEFATRMNRAQKYVASQTLTDVGAWANSELINGELMDEVQRLREQGDVVVIGSIGIARALAERDLVDEYRLLIFPIVVGAGRRLFDADSARQRLRLVSAEPAGPTLLVHYERAALGQ